MVVRELGGVCEGAAASQVHMIYGMRLQLCCVCASYKVISKVGVLCTATEPAFSPYIVGMKEKKTCRCSRGLSQSIQLQNPCKIILSQSNI